MQNLKDSMLAEMVLYTGAPPVRGRYSLAGMSKKYLGISFSSNQLSLFNPIASKATRDEFVHIGDDPFNLRQVEYGAGDVILPLLIWDKQYPQIEYWNLGNVLFLENNFIQVLSEMEYNGIYLNAEKWMKLYYKNLFKRNWYMWLMRTWLLDNGYDEFTQINFKSSKQVLELFKKMKIPTKIKDKLKSVGKDIVYKDTVGKAHVSQFSKKFPFLRLYLEYKKYVKSVTSFGENFLVKFQNPVTGRIHTNFYPIKSTGRVSSSKPNNQQLPRGAAVRAAFEPKEG
jgi:DNA polymerase I-like protein with 3'-5' exonuclease and polymerase domains